MAAFHHVLRLRQLGMTVPRSWCDVGNDLYTSRFGLLLASAYLRNEQLAFDPAKYTNDGVSAEAQASALLNAAEDPAAWAQLMSADKDDSTLPHDVALLCNAAACSRLERRATDIKENVRKFVVALSSEEAHFERLECRPYHRPHRLQRGAFVEAKRFAARRKVTASAFARTVRMVWGIISTKVRRICTRTCDKTCEGSRRCPRHQSRITTPLGS